MFFRKPPLSPIWLWHVLSVLALSIRVPTHIPALPDFSALSNVFTKAVQKAWQALSPPLALLPLFPSAMRETLLATEKRERSAVDIIKLCRADRPSFLAGWKKPQWTRCYRDEACARLPSRTSLFFNYRTSTRGGSTVIYGPSPPRRTYNCLSKPVIVLISHVRRGHPLPCPRGVSMEIESQLLLKDARVVGCTQRIAGSRLALLYVHLLGIDCAACSLLHMPVNKGLSYGGGGHTGVL